MSNDKEKADKALKDLMETPYTDYDGYDAAEEFITDLNKKALKYEAGAPFDGYGNFTDHLAVQSPSGTRGGIVEITTEDVLWSKIERVLGVGLNRTAQTLKYEVRSYLMFLQSSLADMYNEAFENFPEMYVACMQYANLHLKSCSSGSSLSSENGDNWNETIMFLRYLKHISLNIEGMDNDSLKPAYEHCGFLLTALENEDLLPREILDNIKSCDYSGIFAVALLLECPAAYLRNFVSIQCGGGSKILPKGWGRDLEMYFLREHYDSSYKAKTPWEGMPDWLTKLLMSVEIDKVDAIAQLLFVFRAAQFYEVELISRMLPDFRANQDLSSPEEVALVWDLNGVRATLGEAEQVMLSGMCAKLISLAKWLRSGKRVVEITPQSFASLYNVSINRVVNKKAPIRYEDLPLPSDKHYKETVCFKVSRAYCSLAQNMEVASKEAMDKEYEWLKEFRKASCKRNPNNRDKQGFLTKECNPISTKHLPFGKNLNHPVTWHENSCEFYVFVESCGMILDEQLEFAIASRLGRPVIGVGMGFDWVVSPAVGMGAGGSETITGSGDDVLPYIRATLHPFLLAENCVYRAFVDHVDNEVGTYEESLQAIHKRQLKAFAEMNYRQVDPYWENGKTVLNAKNEIPSFFSIGELLCVCANALAAMNRNVKVTTRERQKAKGKRGSRGSRARRSKTLRLDPTGLRTFEKSVISIPRQRAKGAARGPMPLQNVPGHAYKVWTLSPRHGEVVLGVKERTGKTPGLLYCVRRRDGVRGSGYTRGQGIKVDPYRLKRGVDDLGLPVAV